MQPSFIISIFIMFVIWVCICASILSEVSSAPIAEDGEHVPGFTNIDSSQIDYLREKRLNNNIYTMSPCDAAAAYGNNMEIARSPETYANYIPEARYYVPNTNDYANMYRVEDPYRDYREMLRYSDTNFMDQVPLARFAYRTAPGSYVHPYTENVNGLYNTQAESSASAYGVFPNAYNGPRDVPLLFTCSPSVVTGQMVNPKTQVYGDPVSMSPGVSGVASHPDSYRTVDENYVQRMHANQEQAMYGNLTPVIADHFNDN